MPADGSVSLYLYDVPSVPTDHAALVATMIAICDEFEAYGYRRVGAELRHYGIVVNSKKLRRLMRENHLQPKRRKRFVATTDSDHDGPIFPDVAVHRFLDGPNQVWVADITYIAIAIGFVIWPPSLMPVTPGGRICDQSLNPCAAGGCCTEGSHRVRSHRRAAFTTQIAARNMRLRSTAACSLATVSLV